MENEKSFDSQQESIEKKINPNTIGEVLNIGKDLLTSPDKVYRSVRTKEAIEDLEHSGVVRNAQSAGVTEKSRWGERVFWSKGAEGKYHVVSKDGYVIEAPLSVAEERVVTKEDVTAIYKKNENGEVFDLLKQRKQEANTQTQERLSKRQEEDEQKINQIRKDLGLL